MIKLNSVCLWHDTILTSSLAATTNVWDVSFNQINSCNVSFSCQFAQGSVADSCLIQWRLNGTNDTIGNLSLSRDASADGITVTGLTENAFSTGSTYIAEAVGISNGQPTDMLMASTFLTVAQEAGMECFPSTSKCNHGHFISKSLKLMSIIFYCV